MKASSRCTNNSNNELIQQSVRGQSGSGRTLLLPALVALGGGCGLLAGPVSALELGEIQVHSSLGQPLRVSVAYALQPNEQVHDYCIYLKPGSATESLPGISNAAITVANGKIGITGRAAVREPLLSLQLTVDCPHSAHLRREYSVFVDPVLPSRLQPVTPVAAGRHASPPVSAATPPQSVVTAARPAAGASIASSGTYRVQPGDSLSGIASRISGRSVGIWQAVDALFAANTEAFINNDRNLLRAGAVLAIPDSILAPEGISTIQTATVKARAADASAPVSGQSGQSFDASSRAAGRPASSAAAAPAGAESLAATPSRPSGEVAAVPREVAAPRQGDVTVDPESPFVSPTISPLVPDAVVVDATGFSAPAEVIPPTVVEDAASTRTPVARPAPDSSSWSWAIWLGGSGVALILALLLFGRRLKERFLPSYGAAEVSSGRRTGARSIEDTDVSPMPGLPAQGTVSVARVVSLDADLEDGSGLKYGDMDVAQDFGFSDSGAFANPLDLDLSTAAGDRSTGAIARQRFAEGSILVSETPPQHEDTGQYEVSMIVDATKQNVEESEDTARDLGAVVLRAEEEVAEEYDAGSNIDIDYKILEQDYEHEFTATQALNAELARAARELSSQFGKDAMGDTLSDTTINEAMEEFPGDETTLLLPSAGDTLSGDDETTAMPAVGEVSCVTDDTSHLAISSNMTLDDTANEEIALEVPAADNDATIEVDVESATIDTRKMRAS